MLDKGKTGKDPPLGLMIDLAITPVISDFDERASCIHLPERCRSKCRSHRVDNGLGFVYDQSALIFSGQQKGLHSCWARKDRLRKTS